MTQTSNILALDVGTRRIGVARADMISKIAFPLTTVEVDGHELESIARLVQESAPSIIVVGYPRNQSGEPTAQTKLVESFVDTLTPRLGTQVVFQDESLTSVLAEERLQQLGRAYAKADIDAMAAAIILTDYLESH